MIIKRESLKTSILVALIIIILIQLGAMWDISTQGLPFRYISEKLGSVFKPYSNEKTDVAVLKNAYFTPFRITATNGSNEHWILSKADYDDLWEEARYFLAASITGKPMQSVVSKNWGDLGFKRSFTFEFKSPLPMDLAAWFLGVKPVQTGGPSKILKVMIRPFEDDKECPVFILDGNSIYAYSVPFREGGIARSEYDAFIAELEENYGARAFSIVNEMNPGKFGFSINPDILCAIRNEYIPMNTCSMKLPSRLAADIDVMAERILGNEKDSFDRSLDIGNNMAFTGLYNTYHLYTEGLLEYRYLPGAEGSDKGGIIEAYVNAAEFVHRLKSQLIPSAMIGLTKVGINADSYEFVFDYYTDDIPVISDYAAPSSYDAPSGGNGKRITGAITAVANSRRLLQCTWLLRDVTQDRDERSYYMKFVDLLADLEAKYGDIGGSGSDGSDEGADEDAETGGNEWKENLNINDMYAAYLMDEAIDDENGRVMGSDPVYIIENDDGTYYIVPLSEKTEPQE